MTRVQKFAIGCAIALPIGGCIAGIIGIRLFQNNTDAQLDRDLAKLRKANIATEPGQLGRRKPADKDNAAPIYLAASQAIKKDRALSQAFSKLRAAMRTGSTPETIREANLAYPRLRPWLAKAEAAADRLYCHFGHQYDKGFEEEFGEYAAMRSLSYLLLNKAKRQTQAGDDAGALRSLHRIRRIAAHAGDEPVLIGMLVARALDSLAWLGSVRVLKAARATPESIRQVRIFANSAPPVRPFRDYLEGELVLGRATIQSLKRLSDLLPNTNDREEAQRRNSAAQLNLESVRPIFMQRFVAPYAEVLPGMPKDPRAWKQAKKDAKRIETLANADRSPLNILNSIMFPVFEGAANSYGRYYTNYNLLETTLRLTEARTRGGFPAKLPAGETSLDPFTDRPLRYVRKGKSFLLYSVGPNGRDEGGKANGSGMPGADDVSIEFP